MNKRLLIITNVDWFLISHRLVIAKAAVNDGWEVYVACKDTGRAQEIKVNGIKFIPFSFSRSGTNLVQEAQSLWQFRRLYKKIKPDVVHQITLKPVVYGSIAAKMEKINGVVNAISGLGYMFTDNRIGFMQKIILKLIRYGSKRNGITFIFQNNDDFNVLKKYKVIDQRNTINLIKGSGVDLEEFAYHPLPGGKKIKILLPCRMLWDKGVRELREASEILKPRYKQKIQFLLVGMADNGNKSGVQESYLKEWDDGEYVIWKGHESKMINAYKDCHIVVLPSYREGLPKTLIEACAIGRPIVTTDAIGCKDCVDEGKNGFKVPVRDSTSLASALEKLFTNTDLMKAMGIEGRQKAEREFNVHDVVRKHLEIYNSMLHS